MRTGQALNILYDLDWLREMSKMSAMRMTNLLEDVRFFVGFQLLQCHTSNLAHDLPANIGVLNAVRSEALSRRLAFLDDRAPMRWPRIGWDRHEGDVQGRMLGGKKVVGWRSSEWVKHPVTFQIYLSPDSHLPLTRVSPDEVYVVGALCKKAEPTGNVTEAKAHRLGVECRRLPIKESGLE